MGLSAAVGVAGVVVKSSALTYVGVAGVALIALRILAKLWSFMKMRVGDVPSSFYARACRAWNFYRMSVMDPTNAFRLVKDGIDKVNEDLARNPATNGVRDFVCIRMKGPGSGFSKKIQQELCSNWETTLDSELAKHTTSSPVLAVEVGLLRMTPPGAGQPAVFDADNTWLFARIYINQNNLGKSDPEVGNGDIASCRYPLPEDAPEAEKKDLNFLKENPLFKEKFNQLFPTTT
jgi:hypothetical protein